MGGSNRINVVYDRKVQVIDHKLMWLHAWLGGLTTRRNPDAIWSDFYEKERSDQRVRGEDEELKGAWGINTVPSSRC